MIQINDELLRQAIAQWGYEAQINMVQEECLELSLAIQKLWRNSEPSEKSVFNFIDEVADVTIMVRQAALIFGEDLVQARVDFKMRRLDDRLYRDFQKWATDNHWKWVKNVWINQEGGPQAPGPRFNQNLTDEELRAEFYGIED